MQTVGIVIFLLVAAAGVQSTPLEHRSFSSSDCQNMLLNCLSPAIERYVGKDETEKLEEMRNTPLRTHCNEWNTAIGCFRQVIYSDTCDEERSSQSYLKEYFDVYDWSSNYVCVQHFDKVDRNFRCIVSLELIASIISSCSDIVENTQDPCNLVKNKSELLQCTSEAVTGKCGSEASGVVYDFSVKGYEYLEKYAKDVCPASNRARQLSMLKEILRRF